MISSAPKKAVHVKWAGKTIALGTFPIAEADEKCARAKALTRAWRSTIRPKPSREWVIGELERLNVRVVTGRSPRDDEYENNNAGRLPTAASVVGMNDNNSNILGGYHHPSLGNIVDPNFVGRRGSVTASLLNPADVARVNGGGGGPPSTWPRGQGQQAMNSFGFDPSSMMPHQTRTSSLSGSSIVSSSANDITAKESGGTSTAAGAPPHRPLVGGGSAAAYEAARAEHYRQLASNQDTQGGDSAREQAATSFNGSIPASTSSAICQSQGILPSHSMESMSNFGAPGSTMNGSQGRIGGLSLLASQHYEMLKLHHMNLLNEIQETTLMMNIYQQQLQQQQQLEMQQQQQQLEMQHQQQHAQEQQAQEQQQQYDGDDHDSHRIPQNQGVVSPTQQVLNNFGENQYTNKLPRNLPQSKQDDRTDMAGSEHSENTDIDKSDDAGVDSTSLDNDPTIAKHNVGNDKISREDKLARIKAEIEERKRMLEELSMAVDEQEEETFKKPKMSQV